MQKDARLVIPSEWSNLSFDEVVQLLNKMYPGFPNDSTVISGIPIRTLESLLYKFFQENDIKYPVIENMILELYKDRSSHLHNVAFDYMVCRPQELRCMKEEDFKPSSLRIKFVKRVLSESSDSFFQKIVRSEFLEKELDYSRTFQDENGRSMTYHAVARLDYDALDFLCKTNHFINTPAFSVINHESPLSLAVRNMDYKATKILIDHGADVFHKVLDGRGLIELAIDSGGAALDENAKRVIGLLYKSGVRLGAQELRVSKRKSHGNKSAWYAHSLQSILPYSENLGLNLSTRLGNGKVSGLEVFGHEGEGLIFSDLDSFIQYFSDLYDSKMDLNRGLEFGPVRLEVTFDNPVPALGDKGYFSLNDISGQSNQKYDMPFKEEEECQSAHNSSPSMG